MADIGHPDKGTENDDRVLQAMPTGSDECASCCGTGHPSPWEHDYHVWLNGQAWAVCGACRGAGYLSKWGFRLSAAKYLRDMVSRSQMLLGTHYNDERADNGRHL